MSTVGSVKLQLPLKRVLFTFLRVWMGWQHLKSAEGCLWGRAWWNPLSSLVSPMSPLCDFLLYCFITCTVAYLLCSHPSLLLSVFLSVLHFSYTKIKLYYTSCTVRATLPLFAMGLCQTWLLLWECVYVLHLSDTAALMKLVLTPHKLCFSHYIRGQKEISATTVPALASTHKWDKEHKYCCQVTSSNRYLHVPHSWKQNTVWAAQAASF